MDYPKPKETHNHPSFMVDGDYLTEKYEVSDDASKAARIISEFTGIVFDKLLFFIKNIGIAAIFKDPSLIGVTEEQEKLLLELKEVIGIKED